MKDIFLLNNFNFNTIVWNKYHHTDNRLGSPMHYLAYMEKGSAKVVSRDITINVLEDEVFYIPKYLSYQSYWQAEGEVRFKSFGFSCLPENKSKQYLLQKIICHNELKQKIKEIPTTKQVSSSLVGEFYSIFALILPSLKYNDGDSKHLLEKSKKFIYDNPLCKVSDIARHLLISESAIYHTFKKDIGITPNELIQKVRCDKAIQLLTTTNKSVQDISDLLGFSSTSYFRKVLLKHTAKTPREIRKNVAKI